MSDRKAEGIEATNQAFRQYDQVDKRQEYHLAEAHHAEAFDEETRIPTCDIGRFLHGDAADKHAFAEELGDALRRLGFAILEGHGVDGTLYDEADQRILELFTTVPLEEKLRYRAQRFGSVNQGYFPIKETTDIHPDLVEGWVFCRRAFDLDDDPFYRESDFWPRPGDEPLFRRVAEAHGRLILPVMQSLLRSLGCDPHLYDRKLTGTNFGLRLNYYPPMTSADEASGGGRMLGHEDVDLFTFLPASRVEGLQILNRANGKWIRLAAPRGSIILNTGDYVQRISNDIFPSTTHRVSPPRPATERQQPRVSFPMAIYLWEDEVLEVLPGLEPRKYEPIKAIHFHTRITSKYYGDDYAVG
ncbi:MAG TPA: 2-oxoglutarate and iron-dependent oxygenase domain-containing protein [Myxococcaceae bacterium]|nr:2-oxoglutarate and iron-dependent oxygenase domain-containing protein [Myxococcaceae bacterium]